MSCLSSRECNREMVSETVEMRRGGEHMKGDGMQDRGWGVRRLLGIGMLSFLALVSSVLPAFADYAISVSCYSGDVDLGNVEVYDVRLAARVCNDVYYACKGDASAAMRTLTICRTCASMRMARCSCGDRKFLISRDNRSLFVAQSLFSLFGKCSELISMKVVAPNESLHRFGITLVC